MGAGFDRLVYSSLGLRIASAIARAAPPVIGYSIARAAAGWIASRPSASAAAVRCNQQVISDNTARAADLAETVRDVFGYSARSLYELYHYMQDPAAMEEMYCVEPSFQQLLERPEFGGRGLVIAGLHMAGFDLGLRWLCRYKFKPLVLTIADPRHGRKLELEARRAMQMNILPASPNTLRRAIRHLQRGGMVLTGIDHPLPACDCQPRFMGVPAALPTDHVYMALRAQVPVVVGGCVLEADGRYHIHASPPIEMERNSSRDEDMRLNAEKVLTLAGDFIRRAPQQWLVFQPVWPDLPGAPT